MVWQSRDVVWMDRNVGGDTALSLEFWLYGEKLKSLAVAMTSGRRLTIRHGVKELVKN